MSVTLRTARQILRRITADDAQAMIELNAEPEVMRFVVDEPFASVEAARAFFTAYQAVYERDGFARMAAIEIASGECLGWCGLRRQDDGEVDLGYRYRRSAWGRGFATEASLACLDYGFGELGLRRIVGRAHKDNAASIRILEKVGMRFEHTMELEGMPSVQYAIEKR